MNDNRKPLTAPVAAGSVPEPEHYLENIRAIAPLIEDAAVRAESSRRLPSDLLAALHHAQLFRLLLPRAFGGGEISPPAFSRIIEAVAGLDASTAWCLCQANGCAMTAAYLQAEVADEIWGQDPQAALAWGPGRSSAVIDGSGYRVSGKASFASGSRHASWLGMHATVVTADGKLRRLTNGSPEIRTVLFPAAQASMIESWDVMGLRATGSDSFTVDNLPVRQEYTVARDDPAERRYQAPLYLFPAMSLYACGFAGTALGIARSLLDAFKQLASDKTPRLARQVLRDNAVIQADVAHAEAQLGSARAFLLQELDEIWSEALARNEVTVAQRMRIRLVTTHAIHAAKQVADSVYDMAGATAIFESNPFERRFRDIHTVTQQLQGRKAHFQTVGAYMLGLEPDLSVI